jgi:UDP-N-acetylmuramoyl-L-alanyl-D-glutamate--2,6-diaminopimelate ligase
VLFSELFREANVTPAKSNGDAEVGFLCADSRAIKHGEVFVCMPSDNSDSHSFISSAVESGASAVIVHSSVAFENWSGKLPIAFIEEAEFEDSIWRIAKIAFGDPSKDLKIIGVTGTNGKTTVAWLMRDMLEALGIRTAYIGTLGFHLLGEEREALNTTPFSIDVNRMLAECRDRWIQVVAMEVSSHALAQKRVDGVEFDAAVFTNLTQDHLDFHGTMEEYEATKKRLFTEFPANSSKRFVGAVNFDDPVGRKWAEELGLRTFGLTSDFYSDLLMPEIFGCCDNVCLNEIKLRIGRHGQADWQGVAPIGGQFNVQNLVAASAGLAALSETIDVFPKDRDILELIVSSYSHVRPIPGRFEVLPGKPGVSVILDFAHTPDALQKLLLSVKQLDAKRIITVFGCGGDRDRTKRPIMAAAVSSKSDLTVITSDNPRTENPESILRDVEKGILPGKKFVSIVDRPEAVKYAIAEAEPGDVVVIAGKGHQNFHIIGHTKYPMDERELVRDAVEAMS